MRALLDTSVLIGNQSPGNLEGAISAASLAELHFGVLVAVDPDERGRRAQRLGVIDARGFSEVSAVRILRSFRGLPVPPLA